MEAISNEKISLQHVLEKGLICILLSADYQYKLMKNDTLAEQKMKKKNGKNLCKLNLVVNLLQLILMQKILIFVLKLVKYTVKKEEQWKKKKEKKLKKVKSTKKLTEKSTKRFLIDNLSKRLLELEFESNHSIKSNALKYVVKEILSST